MNKNTLLTLLSENYPLLSIVIASALFSITLGPFQNFDTQLEYEAASGVIKWGMPYMKYYGDMINQPPLGFYIEAAFFKIFSLSFNNGTALITLFSLGCIFLVYKIGKVLYGKSSALLAAALFAFTPWQLVLSRSFLIDVPCLFFSLFCLLVGIHAIRRDSEVLFMASSILFAIALLTKFFAIFVLIPLALFYIRYRQKKLSHIFTVTAYFLPALLVFFLWYDVIWGRGLLYGESHTTFTHDDFVNFNPADFSPSYFFVGNFLLEAVGIFFLIAAILSIIVYVFRRDIFAKILPFDLMCIATSIAVIGVNTFLGAGLNLSFPYNNAVKYNYQALPYLSLLAASLLPKFTLLFNSLKSKEKYSLLLFSITACGLALLGIALFLNMHYINYLSTTDHLVFKVDTSRNAGYSFVNSSPATGGFPIAIQYLGFAFLVSGLVWASRHEISAAFKLIVHTVKSLSHKVRKT
ncbi:MAG: glycosyltransferase family 39 protein [Candidatus Bathyarchaeota archaeon]|nr:glycosyltransferase family 39 protein [Candidatus Bathyarchaeota archaeon]